MSLAMLLLVPLAALPVVLLLTSVGCVLDRQGAALGPPEVIASIASNVAYWPLNEGGIEGGPGTTAFDIKGHHDGTYLTYTAAEDPAFESPPANGKLDHTAPSLVKSEPDQKSVDVDGGYVDVPFSADLNTATFSVVAWVKTDWSDSGFYRCVLASRESTAGVKRGYMLYANPSNVWEAWAGDGTSWVQTQQLSGKEGPIELGSINFLCITYDGTTLKLWVDSVDRAEVAVAIAPATANPLRIGAGAPESEPPMFSFSGQIADVAYFNEALDAQTIANLNVWLV